MRRCAWMAGVVLWVGMTAGCVERRFVIHSEPPGALVTHNGKALGAAPADNHFIHYGNHHFTLQKEGYATLEVDQKISRPWYQWFPLDFISENLIPWRIEDVRHYEYRLAPLPAVQPNEMVHRAQVLRERGKSLTPKTPTPPAPTPWPWKGPPSCWSEKGLTPKAPASPSVAAAP